MSTLFAEQGALVKRMVLVAALAAVAAPLALNAQVIVQVRDFKGSSTISVVAWTPDQPNFGLRTEVRQDGSFAGDDRRGEHRLYLGSTYVRNQGGSGFVRTSTGRKLRATATKNDENACKGGGACSPPMTDGFAIPDALLRSSTDSLGVSFDGDTGKAWSIRLRGDLIASFLRVVDSVSTSLKK
jgi:hypothetical protein